MYGITLQFRQIQKHVSMTNTTLKLRQNVQMGKPLGHLKNITLSFNSGLNRN